MNMMTELILPMRWREQKRKRRNLTRRKRSGKQMRQRSGVMTSLWRWSRHQRTRKSWWPPTVTTSGMRTTLLVPGGAGGMDEVQTNTQ